MQIFIRIFKTVTPMKKMREVIFNNLVPNKNLIFFSEIHFIECFYLIFQPDKNNCLCTYRNNNSVDNYLEGIKLFILRDYQVCSHDSYALKDRKSVV